MMELKYAALSSEIELPFYSALSNLKINHDRLDVSARSVLGTYGPPISATATTCNLLVLGNALSNKQCVGTLSCSARTDETI